jgi:cytidyltransferase-like protein
MIVGQDELAGLRGRVTMVDGGFDPLHAGHIEYFRLAAELGAPVLCSVSPDEWVAAKHPPLLPQAERAEVIDAIRYLTYTYLAAEPTADVIRLVGPKTYAKGIDWQGKLPEAELEACAEVGADVVYLDAALNSSTAIMRRWEEELSSKVG